MEKKNFDCSIGQEFRKVVEEKSKLEAHIYDLFSLVISKGERNFIPIPSMDNDELKYLAKILIQNKDKIADFDINIKNPIK